MTVFVQHIREPVALLSQLIVIMAGLIALIAGAYKYRAWRLGASNLDLTFEVSQTSLGLATAVAVAIRVKNIGKVAVFVSTKAYPKSYFWIRRVPSSLAEGVIEWDSLDDLVAPARYLKEWFTPDPLFPITHKDEPFECEPGASDVLHVFVATRYVGVAWLRATFVDDDDYVWEANTMVTIGLSAEQIGRAHV